MPEYDSFTHSVLHESECQVLGILLVKPDLTVDALDYLHPDYMDAEAHKFILKAIIALHKQDAPIDIVTVKQWLQERGKADLCGGLKYLSELYGCVATTQSFLWHCKKVREAATLRGMYRTFQDAWELDESGKPPAEVVASTVKKIAALNVELDIKKLEPPGDVIDSLMEDIKKRDGTTLPGLSTGFYDLDGIISGLLPGSLVTVAARPAMGKSALVMNFAEHVAVDLKIPTAVFSLEMSQKQMFERLLSARAKCDNWRLKMGSLHPNDMKYLEIAAAEIKAAPLYLVDAASGFTTVESMEAGIARLKSEGIHPALVILDYVQQVESTEESATRDIEVGKITRKLKLNAQKGEYCQIILSQLGRSVESRQNKRPMLSDLRESGNIEADSDQVLFIYRDEYYHPDSEKRGEAELIVAKNRHGACGTADVLWQGSITRFLNKVHLGQPAPTKPAAPPVESPRVSDFSIVEKADGAYVVSKDGAREPKKLYSHEQWLGRMRKLKDQDPGEQAAWWNQRSQAIEDAPDAMTRFWEEQNLEAASRAWDEVSKPQVSFEPPVRRGFLSGRFGEGG